MSYKSEYVFSPISGAPIKVSSLPIGVEFSFGEVAYKIFSILHDTDVFREIEYRGSRISFNIENHLYYLKNIGTIAKELLGYTNTNINPLERFYIITSLKFETGNDISCARLISANGIPAINILRQYTYVIINQYNVIDGSVTQLKIIQPPVSHQIDNQRFISKLSDFEFERIPIEVIETNKDWDYSESPIISTQKIQEDSKYWASNSRPIFNVDWQLNGEYESRVHLHPRIYPYLFNKHCKQGELNETEIESQSHT